MSGPRQPAQRGWRLASPTEETSRGATPQDKKTTKQEGNAFLRFYSLSNSGLQTLHITRRDSKWHPLPVSEFRPRSAKGGEWKTTPVPVSQDARLFSRSMRCRNGFNTTTTSGFFTATGPYRARFAPRSVVSGISTTSRSTSIPISFRLLSSSSASGISCSTLRANIPELLAKILLLSHSSCLRRPFAMHFRLFIIL